MVGLSESFAPPLIRPSGTVPPCTGRREDVAATSPLPVHGERMPAGRRETATGAGREARARPVIHPTEKSGVGVFSLVALLLAHDFLAGGLIDDLHRQAHLAALVE